MSEERPKAKTISDILPELEQKLTEDEYAIVGSFAERAIQLAGNVQELRGECAKQKVLAHTLSNILCGTLEHFRPSQNLVHIPAALSEDLNVRLEIDREGENVVLRLIPLGTSDAERTIN